MLSISQLASYAGVTVRAVRHYHAKGLLPEPERDHSGYRRYDAHAVVELIKFLRVPAAVAYLDRLRELAAGIDDRGRAGRLDPGGRPAPGADVALHGADAAAAR